MIKSKEASRLLRAGLCGLGKVIIKNSTCWLFFWLYGLKLWGLNLFTLTVPGNKNIVTFSFHQTFLICKIWCCCIEQGKAQHISCTFSHSIIPLNTFYWKRITVCRGVPNLSVVFLQTGLLNWPSPLPSPVYTFPKPEKRFRCFQFSVFHL